MLECLQDLENFDGGRTDKEGRENKAREDHKLTEISVRNLKEDDFEGNMVHLVKSKKFKLLRNQRTLVESQRDFCEEVACSLVQKDILDMGINVLTLEDAFGKCYLNIPDEFTDQHPPNICTNKGIGENVVEHSSVPKDTDVQEQFKKPENAICNEMCIYPFIIEPGELPYEDCCLHLISRALMQTVLTLGCIAGTVNEKAQRRYSLLNPASHTLLCNSGTPLICVKEGNAQEEYLQVDLLDEKEEVEQKMTGTEKSKFFDNKKKAKYHGQTRKIGYPQLDLLGFKYKKVESEGSLLNFYHLQKPDGQHTMICNKIEELASEVFKLCKNISISSGIALDHLVKVLDSAALVDTNNASEYRKRYEKARANLSAIRKRPERMECFVLSSRDNELFEEGSYASSVQKLMKKDLNRIGVGGNGEVVEAFHQKQHLVIKRTLLRELEYSVVPTLDHKNLLPWFALVCGERSENRPGQLTCYQIMPKMTEDLSASIRAIGGSVHDHMLNCLQENIPKADISVRAELLRRNTSLVFRGILEGLGYLHQQELVHRDIKASNILVKRPDACSNSTHTVFTCDCGSQWEVRIADFDSLGQVAVLRERAARRSKRAMSGGRGFIKVSTTGTSGYRAPEIFEEFSSSDTKDPQYFSPASDMWAFGGVAIHTVMGFSCPSKQYQFGIMMLADKGMVNKTMKFTKGESESLISRTLGLHHIKEGFPGEKWFDMINFVSRPLKIEPKDRPSAAALLQDPFILHYNPRNTPARNGNSANPPPPNITTAPHSICTNQLQGEQLSSTILVTPCQPQEYSAS